MNKKLRKTLSEKCKDMGLTDKALDELSELGSQGLEEDASEEDVAAKADLLVPYAKAMQGEITRKTSKNRNQPKPSSKDGDGGGDNEGNDDKDVPEWFKKQMETVNKKISDLETENQTLKAEKTKAERNNIIAEKAKKLGLPQSLVSRMSFADDADLDKELEAVKQDWVNSNLMPKGAALETGKTEEAMKADAKAWAESLPSK
ncbi:hypothetical protein [Hoylesella loescheii]|uniref:Uncharacterized protein n=1 Tax=Hoylesella loescheii DSM 19665 = JCM 12249 = ATCC 15930 TaxID=1122985 RepID=A0A069QR90_HOYLO|nr:hypothetical protein [Hoylesella loescheii]KDR52361.1 hypothetical protein HMPREF1991_01543 [Hoylesella loescheii DSM 19665 = JCM 12249 = ATCC 15930]